MENKTIPPRTAQTANDADFNEQVSEACSRIAPLWPLSHFVAVNPFLGYADQPFEHACIRHQRDREAEMLLPLEWFREQYEAGRVGMEDLRAAVHGASPAVAESFETSGRSLTAENLAEMPAPSEASADDLFHAATFSAYLDRREGTQWRRFIREEAAKWCAAYFDENQSSWSFPWGDRPLYAAWKAAARIDRNPGCSGLKGFRSAVAALPECPEEAVRQAVARLQIPTERIGDFLLQTLLILPGWAGHVRYLDREKELRGDSGGSLPQLLAILLSYELILFDCFTGDRDRLLGWKRFLLEDPDDTGEPEVPLGLAQRLLWQSALEHAFEQELQTRIRSRVTTHEGSARPEAQAVFCIDVRSEVFRRRLEAVNPKIETLGFAGFFGLPVEFRVPGQEASEARCPALLAPPLPVSAARDGLDSESFARLNFKRVEAREAGRGWKRFREAAASCFTFVETFGLAYAFKLVRDALGLAGGHPAEADPAPVFDETLDLPAKADLAANILKGLGLTENFAPIVLFCGHGSSTRNNPYASGLDCGACGGHAGDGNARLAAGLLNEPGVRAELAARGIDVPDDTRFVAGLHDTTTDAVTLFDSASLPASHRDASERLNLALRTAGEATAAARAPKLGVKKGAGRFASAVRGRSRDWSQVRPEWGLAGNAAFIVAPREWTKQSDLGGRAFLHNYDPGSDPEGSVLESIMGGPLVVTNWINLQYYASAADNAHFGSGNKSIHNVVAGIGVALGNENDLRPGLPLQSVHDGRHLVHEPVRLHACIAAEPERIRAILERQSQVAELVKNGWLHLIALGDDGRQWTRV